MTTSLVAVEDETFEHKVLSGQEKFGSLDTLDVIMTEERSFNKDKKLIVKFVAIKKVLQHNLQDQPTLFDRDNQDIR